MSTYPFSVMRVGGGSASESENNSSDLKTTPMYSENSIKSSTSYKSWFKGSKANRKRSASVQSRGQTGAGGGGVGGVSNSNSFTQAPPGTTASKLGGDSSGGSGEDQFGGGNASSSMAGHLAPERQVALLVENMMTGFATSAFAKLEIADHILPSPQGKTAAELAELVKCPLALGENVERLCNAGVGMGYLHYNADTKKYTLSNLGQVLTRDAPGSMRAYLMGEMDLVHLSSWDRCVDAVKKGTSQTKEVFGMHIWEYYEKNPSAAKVFMDEMGVLTRDFNTAITLTYDFIGSRVVDVGGSFGNFMVEILKNLPMATGVLFELEGCIERAQPYLQSTPVYDRITCQAGDFFTSVPEGDLYLLKWICHDWDDESCVKILRNVRNAMMPGARVCIVDMVIDSTTEVFPILFDMLMLNATFGRERTIEQFVVLFERAGLRLKAWKKTPCPLSVLELVAF